MNTETTVAPTPAQTGDGRQWFCVHTKPKHEHIAAAHIQLCPGAEVFLPRIRFERAFKGGKIWVVEPLFPNYLFARFQLESSMAQIRYAAGVSSLVHFGNQIPVLPDEMMEELKRHFQCQAVIEIQSDFVPGKEVRIIAGAFGGFQALITRVMPGRQRVAVLLEFLGRQVMVEVATSALLPARSARELLPPATGG